MLNYKYPIENNSKINFEFDTKEIAMKEQYKILVVDDHPVNIRVAHSFLTRLGYSAITIAENGIKALESINDDYNLILLDIGLPDIDGFEVCKAMREILAKQIPIIAVTANLVDDNFMEKCKLAGINDVISKPYSIDILELKINRWAKNTKSQL